MKIMRRKFPLGLFIAFLLAILLRLILALVLYGNYDMDSFQIVTSAARAGKNVYAVTSCYNYSPVWFHVLLILDNVRVVTHIPLFSLVRGFISWVDLANAALLELIAHRFMPSHARVVAVGYALSPAAILIAGYHGQFEALALLPVLVAVYGHLRWRWNFWRLLPLLVVGVIVKQNALIIVWALLVAWFGYRRALIGCLLALAAFLITLLPYTNPSSVDNILHAVLTYSGVDYGFGLAGLLPRIVTLVLMGLGFLVASLALRDRGWRVVTLAMLLIWFVSGTYAMQYTVYLLIFAALLPRFRYWLMISSALIALTEATRIDNGMGYFWKILPLILAALWGVFALWLIVLWFDTGTRELALGARRAAAERVKYAEATPTKNDTPGSNRAAGLVPPRLSRR